LSITDPANLDSGTPAVEAAAEIKQQEDAAPQKIKALRYLAKIGCGGCYPSVEDALLDALDDCTEEVRYEAVMALRNSSTKACNFCSATACCSLKVQERLQKIVYSMDESGCYLELSDRVRRQARMALSNCPPAIAPEDPMRDSIEGPSEEGIPNPAEPLVAPLPAPETAFLVEPRVRNRPLAYWTESPAEPRHEQQQPAPLPPPSFDASSRRRSTMAQLPPVFEQKPDGQWEPSRGWPGP
jgi:hypothetical protein